MKKLLSLSLFALILSGSQGYCEIIASFKDNPNSFKKDSEEKAQNQTSRKAAESAGPKKAKTVAKKSVEKKEESSRGNGTRGNYIGISANMNQLNFHEEYTEDITPYNAKVKPSASKYGIGAGLTYKYAINFHDFFIAPGAFFEKNWVSDNGNGYGRSIYYSKSTRLDIDSRYGVTADLGYDFTNKFAAYLMGGYSVIRYTAENGYIITGSGYQSALKKSSDGSAIVGLGAKYNYSDRVSFNVEANTQKFNLKTNADVPYNTGNGYRYVGRYAGRFNTLKVGISYNF